MEIKASPVMLLEDAGPGVVGCLSARRQSYGRGKQMSAEVE